MQTRRDQLQAYRYLLRRVLAAMLGSEPEAIEQPMRRVTTSTFAGIMVGVLACAGVALYGWIADTAASKWKSEANALIVDKQTNAAYLYLPKTALEGGGQDAGQGQAPATPPPVGGSGQVDDADMMLVQVLNYTSARLILGAEPKVVRVSSGSLDGIARGPADRDPAGAQCHPQREKPRLLAVDDLLHVPHRRRHHERTRRPADRSRRTELGARAGRRAARSW